MTAAVATSRSISNPAALSVGIFLFSCSPASTTGFDRSRPFSLFESSISLQHSKMIPYKAGSFCWRRGWNFRVGPPNAGLLVLGSAGSCAGSDPSAFAAPRSTARLAHFLPVRIPPTPIIKYGVAFSDAVFDGGVTGLSAPGLQCVEGYFGGRFYEMTLGMWVGADLRTGHDLRPKSCLVSHREMGHDETFLGLKAVSQKWTKWTRDRHTGVSKMRQKRQSPDRPKMRQMRHSNVMCTPKSRHARLLF